MDQDLKDLLNVLLENPSALEPEEKIELGQILYEKFGTVENVMAELEAATSLKWARIRLDLSGAQPLVTPS
jgi:hypothetical protein